MTFNKTDSGYSTPHHHKLPLAIVRLIKLIKIDCGKEEHCHRLHIFLMG